MAHRVWLVQRDPHAGDNGVRAIFSSYEKAEAYCQAKMDRDKGSLWHMAEWLVDVETVD